MESCRRRINRGIEENTLAILDISGDKYTLDINDDRIAFLEAVRASSIVPDGGTPPTNKMYEAIFKIMTDGKSLELILASFQLLNELDKQFPRLCLSSVDNSTSPCSTTPELLVVNEAWSPFVFGIDVSSERKAVPINSRGQFDSMSFQRLIEELTEVAKETNVQAFSTKTLRNMLLFQYLVNILEGDFLPRHRVYKETLDWTLLRESLLNIVLGSRRMSYKNLIKNVLSFFCYIQARFHEDMEYPENSSVKPYESCDKAMVNASLEVGNCTCIAVQRLLVSIMELDMSKKEADMHGHTSRSDGGRTALVEIIVDELTYNKDMLFPFLQVFNEPKWKLEIVLQYFWKYVTKTSVRTRRSNGSTEDATFHGVLKCLSNSSSTKSIIKKIGSEVTQLLLAHAFQSYLSLSSKKSTSELEEDVRSRSHVEICKNLLSAFRCLNGHVEISPFGKEAVFTAATILSTKS